MIQELAAGDSVEILKLLYGYFWLYHHDTQNKGGVLDLQNTDKLLIPSLHCSDSSDFYHWVTDTY